MRAIINPKVKKHLPYILIFCIAASFLVLFVDYRYAEKYSDFVNVDAVIADVTRETTYHGESQKNITRYSRHIRIFLQRRRLRVKQKRVNKNWQKDRKAGHNQMQSGVPGRNPGSIRKKYFCSNYSLITFVGFFSVERHAGHCERKIKKCKILFQISIF